MIKYTTQVGTRSQNSSFQLPLNPKREPAQFGEMTESINPETGELGLAISLGDGVALSLEDGVTMSTGSPGSKTSIDGWGVDKDYTITREGNVTKVDGWGVDKDYTITEDGNKTVIDGWGVDKDFTRSQSGGTTLVDGWGVEQDYRVSAG